MSFILDALRKSEHERQREAGPTVTRTPLSTARSGIPLWATVTIVLLSVVVAVLAAAWWRATDVARLESTPGAAVAAAAERIETVELPPAPALSPDPVRPSASERAAARHAGTASASGGARSTEDTAAPARVTRSLRDAVESASRSTPASSYGSAGSSGSADSAGWANVSASGTPSVHPSPDAPSFAGQSARSAGPGPALDPSAPNYASAAVGLGLPPLSLELLAYSDTPAQRFAFIGGRRYREGDALGGGLQVLAITPEHVVVQANGRQLRLLPN